MKKRYVEPLDLHETKYPRHKGLGRVLASLRAGIGGCVFYLVALPVILVVLMFTAILIVGGSLWRWAELWYVYHGDEEARRKGEWRTSL